MNQSRLADEHTVKDPDIANELPMWLVTMVFDNGTVRQFATDWNTASFFIDPNVEPERGTRFIQVKSLLGEMGESWRLFDA